MRAALARQVCLAAQITARLQRALGERKIDALLTCLGEPVGSVLDTLDRAARLGLLTTPSDDWIATGSLRNRMVDEYIRLPEALGQAVKEAHAATRCSSPSPALAMPTLRRVGWRHGAADDSVG